MTEQLDANEWCLATFVDLDENASVVSVHVCCLPWWHTGQHHCGLPEHAVSGYYDYEDDVYYDHEDVLDCEERWESHPRQMSAKRWTADIGKAGDIIRDDTWGIGHWMRVTHIGLLNVVGIDMQGHETVLRLDRGKFELIPEMMKVPTRREING